MIGAWPRSCSLAKRSQLLQIASALVLPGHPRRQADAERHSPGMAMASGVTVSRSADDAVRAPVAVAVGGAEWSRAIASSPVRPS
jgi:hypothetical protein